MSRGFGAVQRRRNPPRDALSRPRSVRPTSKWRHFEGPLPSRKSCSHFHRPGLISSEIVPSCGNNLTEIQRGGMTNGNAYISSRDRWVGESSETDFQTTFNFLTIRLF
jgi:hypothetical protein